MLQVEWLVLDEADRLLDLGYEKEITRYIGIFLQQLEFKSYHTKTEIKVTRWPLNSKNRKFCQKTVISDQCSGYQNDTVHPYE